DAYAPENSHPEEWDLAALGEMLHRQFDVRIPPARYQEVASRAGLDEVVLEAVKARYAERERELGSDLLRALERHEMLIVIDAQEGRGAMPGDDRAPAGPPAAAPRPVPRTPTGQKIGRNDPCYCGSGKKYKKCHLLQEG